MKPIEGNVVFHVSDLARSIDFYTTHLGFEVTFRFGEPATYAGLQAGPVELHLSAGYPYKNNTGHGNIYLTYPEVDSLFEQLKAAGAAFYSDIGDREYGLRDFAVQDPDGNQIGIGAVLASS